MKKIRFTANPFTRDLVVHSKSKRISVTNRVLGQDDDVFINHSTGEVMQTSVTTFKQVDDEEFTKLFAKNIALTFNLKSAGIKAFNVLIWCVQYHAINKDMVQLDETTLGDFILNHRKLSLSLTTMYRGIDELINSQIIARQKKVGFYYINPSFCFNGDRIVFMNAIQRKSSIPNRAETQSEIDYEK